MSEDKDKAPERVWIGKSCHPSTLVHDCSWNWHGMLRTEAFLDHADGLAIEYIRADLVTTKVREAREEAWQPIETAPMDGTAVLGYFGLTAGEEPPDMGVTKFNGHEWISTEVPFESLDTPTHWMALPDPPALETVQKSTPTGL